MKKRKRKNKPVPAKSAKVRAFEEMADRFIEKDAVASTDCFDLELNETDDWPQIVLASCSLTFKAAQFHDASVITIPRSPISLSEHPEFKLLASFLPVSKTLSFGISELLRPEGSSFVIRAWYVAFKTVSGSIIELIQFKIAVPGIVREGDRVRACNVGGWFRNTKGIVREAFYVFSKQPYFVRKGQHSFGAPVDVTLPNGESTTYSVRFPSYPSFRVLQAGDDFGCSQPLIQALVPQLDARNFPVIDDNPTRHYGKVNCLKNPSLDILIPLFPPKDWEHPDFEGIRAFRHWPREEWDLLLKLLDNRDIGDLKDVLDRPADSDELKRLISSLKTPNIRPEPPDNDEPSPRPKYSLPWEGPGKLSVRGPFLIYKIARGKPESSGERTYAYLVGSVYYGFALRVFDTLGDDEGTAGALGFVRLLVHGSPRQSADKVSGTIRVVPHQGDFHKTIERAITESVGPPLPAVLKS